MKKEFRDKAGHFTNENNDGGECIHNVKREYRQNTPYGEIIKNDLTRLTENDTIKLSKSEYKIVEKEIFNFQVCLQRKKKKAPRYKLVSTANCCYLVELDGGSFSVVKGFDIERDWEILQKWRSLYGID